MKKRLVEIFTGNCPLCDQTVQLVQEMATSSDQVKVYNLGQGQEGSQYLEQQAERYGLKAVPAIAVDGVVVFTGKPSYKQLQEVWFGQPTISLPSSIYLYAGMGI